LEYINFLLLAVEAQSLIKLIFGADTKVVLQVIHQLPRSKSIDEFIRDIPRKLLPFKIVQFIKV